MACRERYFKPCRCTRTTRGHKEHRCRCGMRWKTGQRPGRVVITVLPLKLSPWAK